jgi:hypothetical protein
MVCACIVPEESSGKMWPDMFCQKADRAFLAFQIPVRQMADERHCKQSLGLLRTIYGTELEGAFYQSVLTGKSEEEALDWLIE